VDASAQILRHLGCTVTQQGDEITVDARTLTGGNIPHSLMREMRSSVIFLGAILARLGEAELSMPGGCELGPRPIDLHLMALRTMGAEIDEHGGALTGRANALHGCEITLSIPSVGATENAMLAAVGARGTVVVQNAAREPEIVDLAHFLQKMGARVSGAGTSTLVVEGRGTEVLHGCEHTILPDRIVTATWMAAVAAAGGQAELQGCIPQQVAPVTALLREAGCKIQTWEDGLTISRTAPLMGGRTVRTGPYPGFPTDAQPPVMGALATAHGNTIFVETMFENRYRHAGELHRMGAEIRVVDRVAVVSGRPLSAAAVEAADLRGGAALVVAALAARGESKITGLKHIDRGYEKLEETLTGLGARVARTPD
jgi:UDP-N-acetylglucosamine 1-carboxyvinyltransferase